MARPWSARCYGVARQREGSRPNSIGGPALTLTITHLRARGRGWPGRGRPVATGSLANESGRAKTALGAPACFLSGISGWFSLSVGAWVPKESGAAKIGFGRRDAARPARAAWAVQAARWKGRWRRRRRFSIGLLISGPPR